MSDSRMWFGNRTYMQWVPCPQVGGEYGLTSAQQSSDYLNGGAFRRNSVNKGKTFSLTWSLASRDLIRGVTDFAEGVYGPSAVFWADPFTMDKNMLTQSFATPSLGGYDGPILAGAVRPVLSDTPTNSLSYPTQSATYTLAAGVNVLKHWVPIPPAHTAWVGVHGSPSSTSGVRVQPTTKGVPSGASSVVPVTSVTSTTRVTHSFAGGMQSGIELSLELPTGGGVVERRRNFNLNPAMSNSTAHWTVAGTGVTQTATVDGTRIDFANDVPTSVAFLYQAAAAVASPAEVWSGAVDVTVPSGYPAVQIAYLERSYGGTGVDSGVTTTVIAPGETKRLETTSTPMPAGTTGVRSLMFPATIIPAGARVIVKRAAHVKASTPGTYFDGSSAPYANVTYAWTGTAGASASVEYVDQSSSTITLSGVMVQVLPTGITPETGGYISGQGHSGCEWTQLPTRDMYSAALDLVGVSASLVETEQWK